MILIGRIEIHVVVSVRDVLTRKSQRAHTVVPVNRSFLPLRAPARFYRWRHRAKTHDGLKALPDAANRAPTQERQITVIECIAIEIADTHTHGCGAHETVERLFEKCLRGRK